MRNRTRKIALGEGVIAGVFFGTAAVFIRFLHELDVFSIVFWRLIIACAALSTLIIAFKRPFYSSLVGKNLKHLFFLGVFLGLHFVFFVSSVKDTTILNATVLVNTTPVFAMLVSSIFFKVKPSSLAILGLTTSFFGICIIAYSETMIANVGIGISLESFSPGLKGDLEAILAALAEAFYLNFGRKIRSQMNLVSLMLPIYLLAALTIGILSLPTSNTLAFPIETQAILFLFGLGLLPTAIAHTLYFSSLSNLKSFETATLALLEPVGATVLGLAIFQEIPQPLFILGSALVLTGIFFVIKEKG
ncbi:MAG: DMT family transporter [Candidatus Bathycorpusculaceae bacterium]